MVPGGEAAGMSEGVGVLETIWTVAPNGGPASAC